MLWRKFYLKNIIKIQHSYRKTWCFIRNLYLFFNSDLVLTIGTEKLCMIKFYDYYFLLQLLPSIPNSWHMSVVFRLNDFINYNKNLSFILNLAEMFFLIRRSCLSLPKYLFYTPFWTRLNHQFLKFISSL